MKGIKRRCRTLKKLVSEDWSSIETMTKNIKKLVWYTNYLAKKHCYVILCSRLADECDTKLAS